MSGADQPKTPGDQADQSDLPALETNLAEVYDLAVLRFESGDYGYSIHLLSLITKFKPDFDDHKNLRKRVAAALDKQQRDHVFSEAKTLAEAALQQQRWDEIPKITDAMTSRLQAENLSLNDGQLRELNQWTVTSIRGGSPPRSKRRGQRLFKPATTIRQPTRGGVGYQAGKRVHAKPTLGERLTSMPQYLWNLLRDLIREAAWMPLAVLALFLLFLVVVSTGLR